MRTFFSALFRALSSITMCHGQPTVGCP